MERHNADKAMHFQLDLCMAVKTAILTHVFVGSILTSHMRSLFGVQPQVPDLG